ncbi:MAG: NAD(P)/FAD-dependent oxidoreductase [Syntrophales bacterium]|nr:NAD(P)/FAD-dependent oxidoreductase [Syntrophales bacterium]
MLKRFDVVIAGAGPAGLSCAEQLQDTGLSVLLLDENREFRAKPCAGGLTPLAGLPELQDGTRLFERQSIYLNSRRFEFRSEIPVRTVSRVALAEHLAGRIRNAANIEFLKGAALEEVRGDEVHTSRGVFQFGKLVGADGSQSRVRRCLGLPFRLALALYCEIPAASDEISVHFRPASIRSGYLWKFPHRDCLNTGIGFDPARLKTPQAKEILARFIGEQGLHASGLRLKGGPLNYCYAGFRFGQVFLAGDAAGMVSKPTGEGISFALISGREIGRKILNPEYPMPELKQALKLKKRQEIAGSLMEKYPAISAAFLYSVLFSLRWDFVRNRLSRL